MRRSSGSPFNRMDKTKTIALIFAGILGLLLVKNLMMPSGSSLRGSAVSEFGVWERTKSLRTLEFAVVADLDSTSRTQRGEDCDADEWVSILKEGRLTANSDGTYSVEFVQDHTLKTKLGEAGRGLELSELVKWQGKLMSFDDRSGAMFEITKDYQVIPRALLLEGDGSTPKGQKTEWATQKDGKLYVGSFGKEYVRGGKVTSRNNMWVNVIDSDGKITHEDWTDKYEVLRQATGATWPGYMVHEAIHFDDTHRLWYVLPRRVSSDPYDEKLDEEKGSNLVLVLDETFSTVVKKFEMGPQVALRGWSSFKFVPFTNKQVIVALKTEEVENKDNPKETMQRTFITVFDINKGELLAQTEFENHKFEGIEFL